MTEKKVEGMTTRYLVDRNHLAKMMGLTDVISVSVVEDFLVVRSHDYSKAEENRLSGFMNRPEEGSQNTGLKFENRTHSARKQKSTCKSFDIQSAICVFCKDHPESVDCINHFIPDNRIPAFGKFIHIPLKTRPQGWNVTQEDFNQLAKIIAHCDTPEFKKLKEWGDQIRSRNPDAANTDTKTIEITSRAYEVLLQMAEGDDISEWIMNEWDGYCDENGQQDVEVG